MTDAGGTMQVRNMRIYFDREITELGGGTLTTPLPVDDDITFTNQDL